MNRKTIFFLIPTAFVVAGIFFLVRPRPVSAPSGQTLGEQSASFPVTQTIRFDPTKTPESQTLTVNKGETVLSLLRRTKKVEVKEYSFGTAVESIDGMKNGTDNNYWTYWVNGAQASVGAGAYVPKAHDSIEWKFTVE